MSRDYTPSAPSAVPVPVTKLDPFLHSPESTWPPSWGKVCKTLFPTSPKIGRALFPPARPYTGSLDSPSSPMSDISSNYSMSSDACQVLPPPITSQLNVTNITFRVFYRPGELPPEDPFTPSTIETESPKVDPTGSIENTFASAAESISEASGLNLVGLESVKSFREVVKCLVRAIRKESSNSPGESDDKPNNSTESIASTAKDKCSVSSYNTFNLNCKAFMSYDMLSRPGKKPTIHDNLESLAWVFLYIVLRYSKHNAIKDAVRPMKREELRAPRTPVRTKNKPNLYALLTLLFCQNTLAEEEYGVGFAKLALFLTYRPLPPDFEVFNNPALTLAVFSLIELFEEKYKYFERILPRKIRALAQVEDISYEEAKMQYKTTHSYRRRMEAMEMLPERMEAIYQRCIRDEGWPEEDVLVDGLVIA